MPEHVRAERSGVCEDERRGNGAECMPELARAERSEVCSDERRVISVQRVDSLVGLFDGV